MKVRRVWSQILFGWLVSRRAITPDAASLASTRLLQMGYRFSSVNADVVVAAGSLVAWDVDATPLREALDQLADPATEFKSIAQVFVQTLKAAWQTGLMERQSRMVTWRALDRFGSRPGARAIIQSIVGRLDGVFGSDERNVRRVSKLLHQWLQG